MLALSAPSTLLTRAEEVVMSLARCSQALNLVRRKLHFFWSSSSYNNRIGTQGRERERKVHKYVCLNIQRK
ncbi:hypothetical protein BDZ89DRAFT_327626 [Hymenopellis radicata]|nr:hypothetical protein BDZ89DRAFT_327626 [Hymenopellis radicata]